MKVTTHDGLDLHVVTDGPDQAPVAAVLAHCWTADVESWRYQVRDLRARFGDQLRIVRYDHRGHGRSAPTAEADATIDNLARDLGRVIETQAPDGPLVLAGHSIGGMTLMALAEQQPAMFAERVAGVVLASTSCGGLDQVTLGLPRSAGERLRHRIPAVLATRSRMLSRRRRRRHPVIESMVARRYLFGRPMRLADHRLVVAGIINTPAESMCGFFADLMRHNRVDALATWERVPVHVLVGARDRLTPPVHARRLADAMPWAELTVVPGAGHMLPLERDRVVTAAIAAQVDARLALAARSGGP